MTFRAEAINLSNTPQFADPGKELTSPNFGQINNTSTTDARFGFCCDSAFSRAGADVERWVVGPRLPPANTAQD